MSKRIILVTVMIALSFLFSGLTVFCEEENTNALVPEAERWK